MSFAKTGAPNSRSTQLFINFGDNSGLDGQGFAPFGFVDEADMHIVDRIYSQYGDAAGPQSSGHGPDQGRVEAEGNAYLEADFP